MEAAAGEAGRSLGDLALDQLDSLWRAAKRQERGPSAEA